MLVNIYGPNVDDQMFYKKLDDFISSNENKRFIIGGDFNTVLKVNLDKRGGLQSTNRKNREVITNIIEKYDLVDIWRTKHGTQQRLRGIRIQDSNFM